MKWLDATYASPAANLACDEALLELCEEEGVETLRFWESPQHFVVVGYANRIESEVNVEACRRLGVPILRRCSGGGTVVQGPGCLNYNLTRRIHDHGPLLTVTATNALVMERNRSALEQLLGSPVMVKGHTDLAVAPNADSRTSPCPAGDSKGPTDGAINFNRSIKIANQAEDSTAWRKFSGNAQRRRRHALVFHGTILYGFDVSLIGVLLRFPSKQPDYRQDRQHAQFVCNIPALAAEVKRALQRTWKATELLELHLEARVNSLVESRYATDAWNLRH